MRAINYDNGSVKINLKPGINMYEAVSASGKSYLPLYIKDFEDAPRIVVIDTKADYKAILKSGIDTEAENTIYFFDRADLFMTEDVEELIRQSSNAVILVDSKKYQLDTDDAAVYIASIVRSENGIEVFTEC